MQSTNADFLQFQKLMEEQTERGDKIKAAAENTDVIEKYDKKKHGEMQLVTIDSLVLTESGELTRSSFFDKITIARDQYGEIALTPDEAIKLKRAYSTMTTGINSSVPLICRAEQCPFAQSCIHVELENAPIGRQCPIELELLYYHTRKFIEEFDVPMDRHSEVMLVQELAELIIYETRVTKTLAKSEFGDLRGERVKFSPDGEEFREDTEHWAFGVKERIKTRRMKILDALNATRKNKAAQKAIEDAVNLETKDYTSRANSIMNKLADIYNQLSVQDAVIVEESNNAAKRDVFEPSGVL